MPNVSVCPFLLVCPIVLLLCFGVLGDASPSYEIDLAVDWDTGTFTGLSRVTFANGTDDPLDEIVFRLFANDQRIYGAASTRVIAARFRGDPLTIDTRADPTVLSVTLPAPLASGQTASLVLEFDGVAAPSIAGAAEGYGILAKNPQSFVLTSFYPILGVLGDEGWQTAPTCGFGDALWSEAADYLVTVTTPIGLCPAASGRLLRSDVQTESVVHRFIAESVRDFALVLLRDFEEAELQSGSLTLRSWFASSEAAASEPTLTIASGAAAIYERHIGPLLYDEIEFVGVPLARAAGVEFSGLILLSSSYAQRAFDPFYKIIVSHETAHQWFYAAVGNDPTLHPWLDEGPATYLSNLYLEAADRPAADAEIRRWQDVYSRVARTYPDLTIGEPSCSYPASSAYGDFTYEGGAWFLHSVRNAVGDDAFFGALSQYYDEHIGGIGTPQALLAAFETASGRDLDTLYEAFGFEPK